MAKDAAIRAEAERLFVQEQCTIAEISSRCRVCEKTIRLWKTEGDWDEKRRQYLTSRRAFHEELYEFARHLMRSIKEDMTAKIKVDASRFYMLGKITPMILDMKEYEGVVDAAAKAAPDGSKSKDLLKTMNEFLGIPDPTAPANG